MSCDFPSGRHAVSAAALTAMAALMMPPAPALAQAAAPVPAAASAASAPSSPEDADAGGMQTISVTAQRVKQKLQDVPAAVTAFSSAAIDALQIQSVMDLSRLVPNVKFDPVTAGSTSLKPFIRGGGVADGGQITSESEVGIYVDDVYHARLSGALVDFVELERLEVVRGPQGVLYGRNSSAGAVNIITRAPTETFTASTELGVGSGGERRIKGYLSAPLSEDKRWLGSVQGMVRSRDTNGQYNVTLKKDVGQEASQGFQADLAYRDTLLQGRLSTYYTHTDGDGQWAVPTTVDARGKIVPATGSYRKVASPVASLTDVAQYGSALHLSTELAGVKLSAITGFAKLDDHWRQDFSGGVANASGVAQALFVRDSQTQHHQFSQELQASGELMGSLLSYVGGLYYFSERGGQLMQSSTYFTPSTVKFNADTESGAAFGQLSARLSERSTLQLGGRYSRDDKHLDGELNGERFDQSRNYARFTPKIGLDHKLSPDTLLYASYSEGFKSGGFNGLASTVAQIQQPFLPQYTKAYELGLKTELFNHTLRLNASLFHNRIENRQQTLTVASGPSAGTFVVESYNAKLSGLELEAAWRLSKNLSLWANGALNEGRYTSCSTAANVSCSVIDNKLPMVPDKVYTLGLDHTLELGDGSLRLGADYNVRSPYYSTADNVAIGAVPRQKLLNAYVAYDIGAWTFQLAGKNLLQQEGWQTGFGFATVQPRFAIPGRTVLLTARYQY